MSDDIFTDSGPLRQCDCDTLTQAIERGNNALQLALACKDCGWDVDAYIGKLQEQLDLAMKTKAKFFRNQP